MPAERTTSSQRAGALPALPGTRPEANKTTPAGEQYEHGSFRNNPSLCRVKKMSSGSKKSFVRLDEEARQELRPTSFMAHGRASSMSEPPSKDVSSETLSSRPVELTMRSGERSFTTRARASSDSGHRKIFQEFCQLLLICFAMGVVGSILHRRYEKGVYRDLKKVDDGKFRCAFGNETVSAKSTATETCDDLKDAVPHCYAVYHHNLRSRTHKVSMPFVRLEIRNDASGFVVPTDNAFGRFSSS